MLGKCHFLTLHSPNVSSPPAGCDHSGMVDYAGWKQFFVCWVASHSRCSNCGDVNLVNFLWHILETLGQHLPKMMIHRKVDHFWDVVFFIQIRMNLIHDKLMSFSDFSKSCGASKFPFNLRVLEVGRPADMTWPFQDRYTPGSTIT